MPLVTGSMKQSILTRPQGSVPLVGGSGEDSSPPALLLPPAHLCAPPQSWVDRRSGAASLDGIVFLGPWTREIFGMVVPARAKTRRF